MQRLTTQFSEAKSREIEAKNKRIEIEEKIAQLVEVEDGKTQKTVSITPVTKLTIKKGKRYKADTSSIREMFDGEPLPAPLKEKVVVSLDEKGYEWYRANRPDVFRKLSKHVTVTPSKPQVSVKIVEK